MQNFKDLYLEMAEMLAEIEGIKWVDLWHNQVNFLEDENPFPSPAVFLSYRTLEVSDMSEKMQALRIQVEVYLFYETFADTFRGAINQESAMAYLELMNDIYVKLHNTDGENYSQMRRIGFNPVDTGSAGNLYQILFECSLVDLAAKKVYVEAETEDLNISNEAMPEVEPGLPMFEVES